MKINNVIKALYYYNPELFGFDNTLPHSIDEFYNDFIKYIQVDDCKKIALSGESAKVYINTYIDTIRDYVDDYKETFIR